MHTSRIPSLMKTSFVIAHAHKLHIRYFSLIPLPSSEVSFASGFT